MSTTVQTTHSHHHVSFAKAALWLALAALAVAVVVLGATVVKLISAPAAVSTGTFAVVAIDTAAKTADGYVRPFETRLEAAVPATGMTLELPQYQDQPPTHLQQGPVS